MAAPLTVWMGRSGSGKSARLYDRLGMAEYQAIEVFLKLY